MSHWCTVGYITNYCDLDGQLELPADLGNDVLLVNIPEWAKDEQQLNHLSWDRKDVIKDECEMIFSTEYEADALFSLMPNCENDKPLSVQKDAAQRIAIAYISIWIVKPTRLTCEVVTHFEKHDESYFLRHSCSSNCLRVHEEDDFNLLTMKDLNNTRTISVPIYSMPKESTIMTAINILYNALQQEKWEVGFVLSWIAMESLFGPEDPHETTYRLSQRAAFFLADSRDQAQELFVDIKRGYSWRSKAVHGLRLHKLKPEESLEWSYKVQGYLRKSLNRILLDSKLIEIFNGRGREEYLDSLIFSK